MPSHTFAPSIVIIILPGAENAQVMDFTRWTPAACASADHPIKKTCETGEHTGADVFERVSQIVISGLRVRNARNASDRERMRRWTCSTLRDTLHYAV
jgi:hypothetical protein